MVMRSPEEKPLASRAAHIAGSQDTTVLWLTCAAVHAAACCLAAVAAATGGEPSGACPDAVPRLAPLPVPGCRVSATVSAPAANTTTSKSSAVTRRHRVDRRCSQSCIVVEATLPQDGVTSGAGRGATGLPAGSTSAPGNRTMGPVTGLTSDSARRATAPPTRSSVESGPGPADPFARPGGGSAGPAAPTGRPAGESGPGPAIPFARSGGETGAAGRVIR